MSAIPGRFVTAKLQSVKDRLGAIVTELRPDDVRIVWSDADDLVVTDGVVDPASVENPELTVDIEPGDVTKLWRDYWTVCLALVDGGEIPTEFVTLLTRDSRRLLAID